VGRSLSGVAGMENEQAGLNISDVIEVIQTTDPEFGVDTMFAGGPMEDSRKISAYVKILEQPAPKALRFRYECEGRSAGSIPGVNSTPENKTFPTIQIVGYKGPAVVVVSCVTKDFPHRPHPHNLVGKEGCKKGICTMRINSETMTVTFSNLGIQCVKKKDIEEALKVREEIRVDPFRSDWFSHRNQPSGIDLNTVRLCFQVFLEDGEREKFTLPLAPIVSDPIYDKKAMSDLVICKLGDCSCTVAGGKEIILLCEKVAKEDIQIYFFELKDGKEVWHGFGDFQPANVHKQYAITFRTPSYKTLQLDAPVTVFIQLRRPSDGATSEALPFQYLPIDSGRPAFWSLRKALSKKGNYSMFSSILASNTALLTGGTTGNGSDQSQGTWVQVIASQPGSESSPLLSEVVDARTAETRNDAVKSSIDAGPVEVSVIEESQSPKNESNNNEVIMIEELTNERNKKGVDANANIQNEDDGREEKLISNENEDVETCRSLNELLSQVAELDEIYSDTRARLLSQGVTDTSAQDADGEPQIIEMDVQDLYDDDNQTYSSLQLAMKNPIELLDLAPGRYEDVIPQGNKRDKVPESPDSKLPPLPPKRIRKSPPTPPARPDHPIFPREAPEKNLPATPELTPAKQAKPSLFQKLFSKKAKQVKKEGSNIPRAASMSREAGVGNISDVPAVRRGSEPIPGSPQAELTEAEHYALYTDMAPHATVSEFDEMSFYYSPVEGGNIITPGENTLNK
ncbi:hypothetical protein L9F63_011741, partial [Diploptera punctata]